MLNLRNILFLPERIAFVLFSLLGQLLGEVAFSIASQLWLVLILTEDIYDVIIVHNILCNGPERLHEHEHGYKKDYIAFHRHKSRPLPQGKT